MTKSHLLGLTGRCAALAVMLSVCIGCSSGVVADDTPRAPICSVVDAEQLTQTVEVRVAPAPGAAMIESLQPGRFVYRCEIVDGWSGIMYPRPSEPVDCLSRASGKACAGGWVEGDFLTEIFG